MFKDSLYEDSSCEVMIVTDDAKAKVMSILEQEDTDEVLGLRVEVTGSAGVDYSYDLCLDAVADAVADDVVYETDGLSVIIPANSVSKLRGATLAVPSTPGSGGLVIRNPNRPNPLGDISALPLTGDISNKVTQLLDKRINPALATHGGFAALVGVQEDNSVLVTMGGGCQGCAMSQATLTSGIKRAILDAVPEVTDVIDATDHSAGDNPYFT